MRVRKTNNGTLLVFPEGHEFRPFKRWLLDFGTDADYYYDTTAGCYVIRSQSIADLERCGFKVDKMSRKQYSRMVSDALAEGYQNEEEGD